jgi:FixJ family two-component response regulator
MSGLQLQARLRKEESNLPIIFITAHGDARMRIRAMREGAAKVLAKTVRSSLVAEKGPCCV